MMLAFLVDQVLQLCDPLFQGALQKLGSKRLLWERMRSLFYEYRLPLQLHFCPCNGGSFQLEWK